MQQQLDMVKRAQQDSVQQYQTTKTQLDTLRIDLQHQESLLQQTQNKLVDSQQHLQWAEEAVMVLKQEVNARDTLLNNQAIIIANLEKEIENIRKGNAMVSLYGDMSAVNTQLNTSIISQPTTNDTDNTLNKSVIGSTEESKEIQKLRYLLTSARAETAKAQADAANLRASLIKLNHRSNISNSGIEASMQTETVENNVLATPVRSSIIEDQAMEIEILRAQLELARAAQGNSQQSVNETSKEQVITQDEPSLSIRAPPSVTISTNTVTDEPPMELATPSVVTRITLHEPTRPPRRHSSAVNSSFTENIGITIEKVAEQDTLGTDMELLSPVSRQLVQHTVPEVPRNHGSFPLADSLNTSQELIHSSSDDQDIQLEILQELTSQNTAIPEPQQFEQPNQNENDDNSSVSDDDNEHNSDWDVEWDSDGELQKSRTNIHKQDEVKGTKSHSSKNKFNNNVHISIDTGGLLFPSPKMVNKSRKQTTPLNVARASPLTPNPFYENNNNQSSTENLTRSTSGFQETIIMKPITEHTEINLSLHDENEEDSWTLLHPGQ